MVYQDYFSHFEPAYQIHVGGAKAETLRGDPPGHLQAQHVISCCLRVF